MDVFNEIGIPFFNPAEKRRKKKKAPSFFSSTSRLNNYRTISDNLKTSTTTNCVKSTINNYNNNTNNDGSIYDELYDDIPRTHTNHRSASLKSYSSSRPKLSLKTKNITSSSAPQLIVPLKSPYNLTTSSFPFSLNNSDTTTNNNSSSVNYSSTSLNNGILSSTSGSLASNNNGYSTDRKFLSRSSSATDGTGSSLHPSNMYVRNIDVDRFLQTSMQKLLKLALSAPTPVVLKTASTLPFNMIKVNCDALPLKPDDDSVNEKGANCDDLENSATATTTSNNEGDVQPMDANITDDNNMAEKLYFKDFSQLKNELLGEDIVLETLEGHLAWESESEEDQKPTNDQLNQQENNMQQSTSIVASIMNADSESDLFDDDSDDSEMMAMSNTKNSIEIESDTSLVSSEKRVFQNMHNGSYEKKAKRVRRNENKRRVDDVSILDFDDDEDVDYTPSLQARDQEEEGAARIGLTPTTTKQQQQSQVPSSQYAQEIHGDYLHEDLAPLDDDVDSLFGSENEVEAAVPSADSAILTTSIFNEEGVQDDILISKEVNEQEKEIMSITPVLSPLIKRSSMVEVSQSPLMNAINSEEYQEQESPSSDITYVSPQSVDSPASQTAKEMEITEHLGSDFTSSLKGIELHVNEKKNQQEKDAQGNFDQDNNDVVVDDDDDLVPIKQEPTDYSFDFLGFAQLYQGKILQVDSDAESAVTYEDVEMTKRDEWTDDDSAHEQPLQGNEMEQKQQQIEAEHNLKNVEHRTIAKIRKTPDQPKSVALNVEQIEEIPTMDLTEDIKHNQYNDDMNQQWDILDDHNKTRNFNMDTIIMVYDEPDTMAHETEMPTVPTSTSNQNSEVMARSEMIVIEDDDAEINDTLGTMEQSDSAVINLPLQEQEIHESVVVGKGTSMQANNQNNNNKDVGKLFHLDKVEVLDFEDPFESNSEYGDDEYDKNQEIEKHDAHKVNDAAIVVCEELSGDSNAQKTVVETLNQKNGAIDVDHDSIVDDNIAVDHEKSKDKDIVPTLQMDRQGHEAEGLAPVAENDLISDKAVIISAQEQYLDTEKEAIQNQSTRIDHEAMIKYQKKMRRRDNLRRKHAKYHYIDMGFLVTNTSTPTHPVVQDKTTIIADIFKTLPTSHLELSQGDYKDMAVAGVLGNKSFVSVLKTIHELQRINEQSEAQSQIKGTGGHIYLRFIQKMDVLSDMLNKYSSVSSGNNSSNNQRGVGGDESSHLEKGQFDCQCLWNHEIHQDHQLLLGLIMKPSFDLTTEEGKLTRYILKPRRKVSRLVTWNLGRYDFGFIGTLADYLLPIVQQQLDQRYQRQQNVLGSNGERVLVTKKDMIDFLHLDSVGLMLLEAH